MLSELNTLVTLQVYVYIYTVDYKRLRFIFYGIVVECES